MKVGTVLAALAACVASAQAQAPVAPMLTGSFVVFDRNLTPAMWQQELAAQAALGQKILVLPADGTLMPTASDATGFTVNPQTLLYPSGLFPAAPARADNLEMLLTAADQFGMQVFIGSLTTSEVWSNGDEFSALHKFNPLLAQEILARYGWHPSLSGGNWYFAQELWLNWVKYYGPSYYGIAELHSFVSEMKTVSPRSRVVAAPVFKESASGVMPALTAQEAGAWLAALVSGSQVSIVAPQDGAGAQAGAPTVAELGGYYSAMHAALRRRIASGVAQLWTTLETFQAALPGSETANGWQPAPLARIAQQLAAEAPYVSQSIEFMYGWDMSPQATYTPVEAEALLTQYAHETTGTQPLSGGAVTYSIAPSPSYADTATSKLTNGTGGGFAEPLAQDWVGFAGNPSGAVTVTVNLGSAQTIVGVRALFAGWSDAGIEFPQAMVAEYSRDGLSWLPLGSPSATPATPTPQPYTVAWIDANNRAAVVATKVRITVNFTQWLFLGEIKTMAP